MATSSRPPSRAASGGPLGHVVDVRAQVRLEVRCGGDQVGRTDQPAHPPAGHGVGLGHAVEDDGLVGRLRHEGRQRRELVVVVDEVLVDLVGDDPEAVLDGPAADGLDLVGRVHRARGVRGRDEDQRLGAIGAGGLQLVDGDPEAGGLVGGQHDRRPAGQRHRLGVGGPVGGGQQHLVARVHDRLDGLVVRLLAAVGDDDLAGADVVAGVPLGLVGDGLAQRGEARRRRVVVAGGVLHGGQGGLDDVGRRREVGLAGAEADHVLTLGLHGLGLGVHGQGGRRGDGGDPCGEAF